MSTTVIGTCSLCGGPVEVPSMYMSVIPPVPTCRHCGATKAQHGPVVEMQPSSPQRTTQVTTRWTTGTRGDGHD